MSLVLEHVSKRYANGKQALQDISGSFDTGIVGIIGSNGSGKTTLLRILATTLAPSSGTIAFRNLDVVKDPLSLRRELAYMPQNFGVYERLNALEFIEYLLRIRGAKGRVARKSAKMAVEYAGLGSDARRPLGTYSPGMLQRVGLAYVFQTDASVVILDEPTAGLDPETSRALAEALTLRAKQSLIFLCTHVLSDLDVADRIVRLRDGRIDVDAPRQEVMRSAQNQDSAGTAGLA